MIVWPSPDMTFLEWADALRLTRPDIEIQPIITDKTPWTAWAGQVIQSQVCQTYHCPRPEGFKKWEDWAVAFIRSFGPNA